jgi:hypothetical protein
VPLTDSLISYWKMDEASGNEPDAHGSNTLTDNNTVGSAAGKINTGRDFNGTDEYLSHASDLLSGATACSVQAWVYSSRASLVFRPDNVFYVGDNGATGDIVAIDFEGDGSGAKFRFIKTEGFGGTYAKADNFASVATWYHLVGTVSTAGVTTLYVNGVAQATTGSLTNGAMSSTASTTIGCRNDLTGASFWQGTIDEVAIWSRELSAAEVTELYGGGSGFAYPMVSSQPVQPNYARFPRWFMRGKNPRGASHV